MASLKKTKYLCVNTRPPSRDFGGFPNTTQDCCVSDRTLGVSDVIQRMRSGFVTRDMKVSISSLLIFQGSLLWVLNWIEILRSGIKMGSKEIFICFLSSKQVSELTAFDTVYFKICVP